VVEIVDTLPDVIIFNSRRAVIFRRAALLRWELRRI
jgi:hypothetical protein